MVDLGAYSLKEKLELLALLEEQERRHKQTLLYRVYPEDGPLRRDLYPKHLMHFRAGQQHHERALVGGNRSGKALAHGMPVLTPSGFVAIERLRVGDTVIGGDGNPCSVTGVYPQGLRQTMDVTFDDGASVICDLDHLWRTRQGKERYKSKDWVVRSLREIRDKGAFLGDPQRVAEIPVCSSYMTQGEVPIDPYIVGLMLGDGCYSQERMSPCLSTADDEIIEYVSRQYPTSLRNGTYDYGIRGGLRKQLKFMGMWGKKAHEKLVPKDYLLNSRFVRLAVLRGLMDTDGYVSADGRSTVFYSTSNQLCEDVSFLVRSLGGKATRTQKQTYFYQKGVKVAGRPSWAITIRLGVCPFLLARKASRWKPITKSSPHRRFVSSQDAGVRECTCISVDSQDQTYVTRDFIVTHNTFANCFEISCHMTGWYPHWWEGVRFDHPVIVWASGEDTKAVRESLQVTYLGPVEDMGTGLVPGALLLSKTSRPGVPDAVDSFTVRHASGGTSRLMFKSYDQGRESFQAAKIDIMQFDEEPPQPIYSEGATRTMSTVPGVPSGQVMCGFTPLRGLSTVVMAFMPGGERKEGSIGNKHLTFVAWSDVPHLDEAAKASLLSAYLPHERDARTKGIPSLGAGAIYPVPEEDITVKPFEIPPFWRRSYAMDVGWNRTAALFQAYDEENDTVYVYEEYYRGEAEPSVHAAAIRARGTWIPGVIDPASRGRQQRDGEQLFVDYINLGLNISMANNARDAGIYRVWTRLTTGRLKIFSTCQNFFNEYRIYRRDEKGAIVKQNDHLMDCLRYMEMSGIDVSAYMPVEEFRGRVPGTSGPRHQAAYNPMDQMLKDGQDSHNGPRHREPYIPFRNGGN